MIAANDDQSFHKQRTTGNQNAGPTSSSVLLEASNALATPLLLQVSRGGTRSYYQATCLFPTALYIKNTS